MNWFFIALLPPALWSVTNHFDKYLLSRFFKGGGVGALMIFSSLIGLLLLPVICIVHPEVLSLSNASFLIALSGFLYVLAVLPYFYALQRDEASVCVPLFQLIPVFSYILSFLILGETLSTTQLLGGVLIVSAAIAISLDLSNLKKVKLKGEVLGFMVLSSVIFSLNFILFKYFAVQSNFWFTSFWEYVGFATFGMILLAFVKPYRKEFFSALKNNSIVVLGLNTVNEIVNIVAKISFNIASLLAPVTLVWLINGFQPFFVFFYGIILTFLLPKIAQENVSRRVLFQKIIAISIMLVGAYLIERS